MPETRQGPGRMLITVYGIFAIAATSRSAVQIATRFSAAPVAYVLSAFAAVVYVLATVALALDSRRTAFAACSAELAGVLLVGAASLVVPQAFPDATVWSFFGIGYGFVPIVLPILGLWWLRRTA
jgi:hypothetical protein